jgi:hypothetical protein
MSEQHGRESAVIREEIADLIAYLGGLPEHILNSGAFDAYKQRLIGLDGELALSKPEGMQWRDYNDLSQRYAGFGLYELAATTAERAIEVLDRSKQRTLGITAIGAAAFWFKAGNFREVQRVCDFWIAEAETEAFPDFAVVELEEILRTIQSRYELKPEDIFSCGEPIKRHKKHLFVGHRSEIRDALRTIEDGFSLIITGEKGVGKTSFAWQLMELLSGVPEACDLIGIAQDESYNCVWLDCNTRMKTLEGILISVLQLSCKDYTFSRNFQEIFRSTVGLQSEITDKFRAYFRYVEQSPEILEDEYPKHLHPKVERLRAGIEVIFREILVRISNQKNIKTIIFLDSIEKVLNTKGLGNLIKTTAERGLVQYVIIGEANKFGRNILSDDDPSSTRYTSEIQLRGFTQEDIVTLLSHVERANPCIVYSQDFRDTIISNIVDSSISHHENLFNATLIQEMVLNSTSNAINRYDDLESFLIVTSEDFETPLTKANPNKQETIQLIQKS